MITLENLNALSKTEAFIKFEQCCVSKTWVNAMVENRPFASENNLIKKRLLFGLMIVQIMILKKHLLGIQKLET